MMGNNSRRINTNISQGKVHTKVNNLKQKLKKKEDSNKQPAHPTKHANIQIAH